ncbi:ankyrin repeat-containing domain protein [Suillus cothurnatus]|nr:ankyrin repeat-containing domain protein [Suillus cothurnatus]
MKAVESLEHCKTTLSVAISSSLLSHATELTATTKEIQEDVKDQAENIKQEISKKAREVRQMIEDVREEISNTLDNNIAQMIAKRCEQERLNLKMLAACKRKDLLQWLDGFDCTVRHEEVSAQRQENMCTWVFEMKVFHQWRTPPTGQHSKFLWINGKRYPRILTRLYNSAIIKELLAYGETPVYFYCDFHQERTTDGATILCSLLIQLLRQAHNQWIEEFTDLLRRKSEGAKPPTDTDVLCDLICRSLKFLQHPVAIIDALDECKLIETFLSRLLCAANEGAMQLLIIKLDARRRLASLTPNLKDEIRRSLLQKADGMFRWVHCQLDAIGACQSLQGISDSLKSLPKGLHETYDRILQEIEEAGPDCRSIVERTLMWLVAALEPLNLSQLAEALSIEIGNTALNRKLSVMSPTDLFKICSSLEYLMAGENTKKYHRLLEDPHRDIVQYCTQYLISDDVLDSIHTRPMLRYALDLGLRAHITSIIHKEDSVLSCLEDLPEQICVRHPWSDQVALLNPWQIWLADPQSICDTLIRFGPDWMVHTHLLKHQEHWNHVLQYAILEGKTLLANVVLSLGRNVNLPITIGLETTSPVKFALWHSPQKLIECFLSRGAHLPVDAIHTVLEERQGVDFDILSLLIWYGANVHVMHVHFQDNPLHTLLRKDAQSQESYLEAARVLVGAGCKLNSRNPAGWTPLDLAIKKLFNAVGDYLLQLGATASADVIRSSDVICWHLENKRFDIFLISTLLRRGVDVNKWTNNWLELAHLLVDTGCLFDIQDSKGYTPLHLAIRHGSPNLLEYLIAKGAHIPLDAIHHHLEDYLVDFSIIHMLIQHGADVNAVRKGANTLHALLSCWNRRDVSDDWLRTAQLLIETGCSIDTKDEGGNMPLRLAVKCGSLPLVKDLIGRGVHILVDAIHHYLENNLVNHGIISTLIQHGFNVNSRYIGRNPLHSLLHHRDWREEWINTMRILVEMGSSLDAVDEVGHMPIYLAIKQGSVALVNYLIGRGARVPADAVFHNLKMGRIDPAMASVLVQSGINANAIGHDGSNLLHALIGCMDTRLDCIDIAGVLIDVGCALNATNGAGKTPLHLAVERQSSSFIEYLIGRGSCGRYPCCTSIHSNKPGCCSVLVRHRAEVDVMQFGASPLHILLARWNWGNDCLEAVLVLIEAGCSSDAIDANRNTPLHLAIRNQSLPLVKYLIQRGARLPEDAIHLAVHPTHDWEVDLNPDVTSVLIFHGADVNALRCGANPLHTLLQCLQRGDCLAIARILIDAGCEYNCQDSAGYTPLCLAMIHEVSSVTEYLLLKGASLQMDSISSVIKDSNLDVVPDIVQNLLQHVTDADVSSQLLMLLGHHSSSQLSHDDKCLEIARVLVDAGCEHDVADSAKYSPLIDLAITQSLPHVTQHFLQVGSPIHVDHPVNVTLNNDISTPFTPNIHPEEQRAELLLAWQTDCQFQTMWTLIEAGHNFNSRDSTGQTPLGIAIQKQIPSAVNYILRKLACRQLDFFCGAALEEHNVKVIEALLQSSTPLHKLTHNVFTGPVGTHNFYLSSNWMHGPFCEWDCGEILLILINEGFSVNAVDSSGDNIWHPVSRVEAPSSKIRIEYGPLAYPDLTDALRLHCTCVQVDRLNDNGNFHAVPMALPAHHPFFCYTHIPAHATYNHNIHDVGGENESTMKMEGEIALGKSKRTGDEIEPMGRVGDVPVHHSVTTGIIAKELFDSQLLGNQEEESRDYN